MSKFEITCSNHETITSDIHITHFSLVITQNHYHDYNLRKNIEKGRRIKSKARVYRVWLKPRKNPKMGKSLGQFF